MNGAAKSGKKKRIKFSTAENDLLKELVSIYDNKWSTITMEFNDESFIHNYNIPPLMINQQNQDIELK